MISKSLRIATKVAVVLILLGVILSRFSHASSLSPIEYDFTSTFDSISIEGSLIYDGPLGKITPNDLNSFATWNLIFYFDNNFGPSVDRVTNKEFDWTILMQGEGEVSITASNSELVFEIETPTVASFASLQLNVTDFREGTEEVRYFQSRDEQTREICVYGDFYNDSGGLSEFVDCDILQFDSPLRFLKVKTLPKPH
ncbi:MAG: hypothetical protein AAGE96_06670 [Cyanobacteria bacterium P01_G01_bin.19]